MYCKRMIPVIAAAATMTAMPALASVFVTYQEAAAPTYSTTLNFDEVGGPTGNVPGGAWQGSHGVTSLVDGVDTVNVGDHATTLALPWLGTGNSAEGVFGLYMNFDNDLTEFSAQVWDNSGPATFFGGGALAVALDNGAEVGSLFIDFPTFSATGPTWLNITTDGGTVFDEVRIVGFGNVSPTAYMDNASWNAVPEPGTLAMFALGGLVIARRRKH